MTPAVKASGGNITLKTTFQDPGKDLLKAAETGSVDGVMKVLGQNVSVNHKDPTTGETSLHLAVRFNHVAVVDLLLSKGADPYAEDVNGSAPRDISFKASNLDPRIPELFQSYASASSFFSAIERDDYQEVRRLLSMNVKPTFKQNGFNALHIAAARGSR